MRISLELELHLPFPARNGRSVSQPKKAPRQSNEERRGGEKIINPAESVRYGAAVTHARLFTSKCYCIVRCSNIRTPVLPLRTVLGESSSLEQLLPRENVTNSTSCELCDDAGDLRPDDLAEVLCKLHATGVQEFYRYRIAPWSVSQRGGT